MGYKDRLIRERSKDFTSRQVENLSDVVEQLSTKKTKSSK